MPLFPPRICAWCHPGVDFPGASHVLCGVHAVRLAGDLRATVRPAALAAVLRWPSDRVMRFHRGDCCTAICEAPRGRPCRTVEPLRSCRAAVYGLVELVGGAL